MDKFREGAWGALATSALAVVLNQILQGLVFGAIEDTLIALVGPKVAAWLVGPMSGWMLSAALAIGLVWMAFEAGRKWRLNFGPTIKLKYEFRDPWVHRLERSNFTADGKPVSPPLIWFRVQVLPPPDEVANGCKSYLRSIEFLEPAGFTTLPYDGAQQLRWADRPEFWLTPRKVSAASHHYVDFLSADAHYNRISIKWGNDLIYHEKLFDRLGVYRLTVTAESEDCGMDAIALILLWPGDWTKIQLLPYDKQSEDELRASVAAIIPQAA